MNAQANTKPKATRQHVARLPDFDKLPDCAIVREAQILPLLGVSRWTLRRMLHDGEFPPSFAVSDRARGWQLGTVRAWLAAKAEGAQP